MSDNHYWRIGSRASAAAGDAGKAAAGKTRRQQRAPGADEPGGVLASVHVPSTRGVTRIAGCARLFAHLAARACTPLPQLPRCAIFYSGMVLGAPQDMNLGFIAPRRSADWLPSLRANLAHPRSVSIFAPSGRRASAAPALAINASCWPRLAMKWIFVLSFRAAFVSVRFSRDVRAAGA